MSSEKYRDPRWQKLRLRVFDRDGWKCVGCGAAETTLHVHHLRYNGRPWESDPEDLTTLCETCHQWLENAISDVRNRGARHPEHVANGIDMLLNAGDRSERHSFLAVSMIAGINYSDATIRFQVRTMVDIRRASGEKPEIHAQDDYSI